MRDEVLPRLERLGTARSHCVTDGQDGKVPGCENSRYTDAERKPIQARLVRHELLGLVRHNCAGALASGLVTKSRSCAAR